jgi:hypothetical protein
MIEGLFGSETAHANPLLGDTVILGELAKCTIAELVYP